MDIYSTNITNQKNYRNNNSRLNNYQIPNPGKATRPNYHEIYDKTKFSQTRKYIDSKREEIIVSFVQNVLQNNDK